MVEVQERAFGPTHSSVAATLADLCTAAGQQGRHDQALAYCRRALAISKQVYAGEHLDLAHDTAHLGWVHMLRGEPDRAEPLLRQALQISERLLDPASPELVPILNDLAEVLLELRQLPEAEQLLQRAREILPEASQGMAVTRQTDAAQTLLTLGKLRATNGQRQAAIRRWQQVLEIGGSGVAGTCALRRLCVHAQALLLLGRVEAAKPLVEAVLATGASPPQLLRLWEASGGTSLSAGAEKS